MPDLNIRGLDERTMQQISMAAARRGGKGGKRLWAIQILAAAAREELAGRQPFPRLKLCARCFKANEALASAPVPLPIASPTIPSLELSAPTAAAEAGSFADLLEMPKPPAHDQLQTSAKNEPAQEIETEEPTEICPGIFVGSDHYVAWAEKEGLAILSAAKEPWHRQMVGYQTKSAPEGPERLFAERGNRMALNLIDVRQLGPGGEAYVPEPVLEAGLKFIETHVAAGDRILIHCNEGRSQSPLLAFLHMRKQNLLPWRYSEAAAAFQEIYPDFRPGAGITAYLDKLERQEIEQEVAS